MQEMLCFAAQPLKASTVQLFVVMSSRRQYDNPGAERQISTLLSHSNPHADPAKLRDWIEGLCVTWLGCVLGDLSLNPSAYPWAAAGTRVHASKTCDWIAACFWLLPALGVRLRGQWWLTNWQRLRPV